LQIVQVNPVTPAGRLRRSALAHVAQRTGKAATVASIRISTDIEINVNEEPQRISVTGKDIR
jgi:hypothetical protein